MNNRAYGRWGGGGGLCRPERRSVWLLISCGKCVQRYVTVIGIGNGYYRRAPAGGGEGALST